MSQFVSNWDVRAHYSLLQAHALLCKTCNNNCLISRISSLIPCTSRSIWITFSTRPTNVWPCITICFSMPATPPKHKFHRMWSLSMLPRNVGPTCQGYGGMLLRCKVVKLKEGSRAKHRKDTYVEWHAASCPCICWETQSPMVVSRAEVVVVKFLRAILVAGAAPIINAMRVSTSSTRLRWLGCCNSLGARNGKVL